MSFFYLIPSKLLLYKERREKTLTVRPTPEDSDVKLIAKKYIQEGNSITVMKGHEVEWTVSRKYFFPKSGRTIVRKNMVLTVDLDEYAHYTLTINVLNHSDATVTFTSVDGAPVGENKYWAHDGSTIKYRVYKAGYFIETGSVVMDRDITLDVELETSYGIIYPYRKDNPNLVPTGIGDMQGIV